jgi:methyl-accepting chemotaxis protein
MDRKAKDLASLRERQRGASEKIEEVSARMVGSSESLAQVSHQLAVAFTETVDQATTIRQSTGSINQRLKDMLEVLRHVEDGVRKNSSVTATVSHSAESTRRTAESANALMQVLGTSSMAIGKVTTVIASFAEQTNLLALNATIEASRAGEAGRGFSVVAGEVKDLARRTAQSSKEIDRLIEAMQADVRKSVEIIGQIAASIGNIETFSNAVHETVTKRIDEVARLVSEAVRIADDVNAVDENVQSIEASMKQKEHNVGLTSVSATEMLGLSGSLRELIHRTGDERPA